MANIAQISASTYQPMSQDDARAILHTSPSPSDWEQLANYSSAHYILGDMDTSLDYAYRSLAIERNTANLFNLAVILEAFGRFDEAHELAEKLYAVDSSNFELSGVLAESLLRRGDWHRGWPVYVQSYVTDTPLHRYIPRWTGHENLRGKRLLVLQNGGIGDSFLFVRFLIRIQSWGARITYCGPESITPLLSAQDYIDAVIPTHGQTQIIDRIVPREFDYITTVMELACCLDVSLDDVLWRAPYIDPPAGPRLAHSTRPLLGICWEAGEYVYPKRRRSLSPEQRDRILAYHNVDWINLQYGAPLPSTRNLDIAGWSATASIVSQLDLVVSVDTATAHLAGALGVPVWVPLCGASAGLYLASSDRVPYYPSMRLFRNCGYGIDNAVWALCSALESL